ncbi:MAG: TRAP transporter small permease subunit [Hyphomicrobiaceae bacterium]|nr:MAG: TRAP transporter small permease subunit [Hyphomicrobiaceae bacterium]
MTGVSGRIEAAERRESVLGRLVGALALISSLLTTFIAMLVTLSVLKAWLTGRPISDVDDYVGVLTAIALFGFLPYCEQRRGHVIVDTFTSQLRRPLLQAVDALWDVVYAAIMGILTYCLLLGAIEKHATGETAAPNITTILKWPVIAVVAVLAAILAATALLTALERIRRPA